MALICLATHAGEVPSAGKVVGNHTGTFKSTFPANEGTDVIIIIINDAIPKPIVFLIIIIPFHDQLFIYF
jgi:hypothetical protein